MTTAAPLDELGKTAAEAERREVNQLADDVEVRRTALAAGWFLTRNLLTKVEYVTQEYDGFAPTDIRSSGKFNGFLIEGVIAF